MSRTKLEYAKILLAQNQVGEKKDEECERRPSVLYSTVATYTVCLRLLQQH